MNVAAILSEKGRDVATAPPQTTLLEISKILTKHGIGSIVILDDAKAVVGIVSERDIVRTISNDGIEVLSQPVSGCMTKDVVTCQEDNTVDWIMSEMSAKRFRHMPVVENGELVGIVSIGDVVRRRIAEAEMEAASMRQYIATG